MRFRDAKRLHNGDEVVDKATGESVRVLSVAEEPRFGPMPPQVVIEGIGDGQGYARWYHGSVR